MLVIKVKAKLQMFVVIVFSLSFFGVFATFEILAKSLKDRFQFVYTSEKKVWSNTAVFLPIDMTTQRRAD